jgi:tripartite-type tricarboxylate transporter receptor subunit TctC
VEALHAGQVQMICVTVADALQMARSRDFRVLGVAAARREPELPDVPTMEEQGFAGLVASSWNAYLAPAATPAPVLERLSEAFSKASADPGVQERLSRLTVQTLPMTQPELARFLQEEAARWRRVVEENAIRLEN